MWQLVPSCPIVEAANWPLRRRAAAEAARVLRTDPTNSAWSRNRVQCEEAAAETKDADRLPDVVTPGFRPPSKLRR